MSKFLRQGWGVVIPIAIGKPEAEQITHFLNKPQPYCLEILLACAKYPSRCYRFSRKDGQNGRIPERKTYFCRCMKRIVLLGISLLLLLPFDQYQILTAQNPFELQNRIEKGQLELRPPLNPANPFEIEKATVPVKKAPSDVSRSSPPSPVDKAKAGQFRFWLLAASLLLLTLLITLNRTMIVGAYRSFVNQNFLKLMHRDEGRILSLPHWLFYGLFAVSAATFLYLITDYFGWQPTEKPLHHFMLCLSGVILVYFVKHLLLLLVGTVFPIAKTLRLYSYTIVIFNIILGVALMPFNLVIAFTTAELARVLIYLAIGLLVLVYAYRAYRGLLIAGKAMSLHKFHFFMYLCTVEIAPVLVLLRLVGAAPGL